MGFGGSLYRVALSKKAEQAALQQQEIVDSLKGLSDAIGQRKTSKKKIPSKWSATPSEEIKQALAVNPLSLDSINFDIYMFDGTPSERDKARRQSEKNVDLAKKMAKSIEIIADNTKQIHKQDTKKKNLQTKMSESVGSVEKIKWKFDGLKNKFDGIWKTVIDWTTWFAKFDVFTTILKTAAKIGIGAAIGTVIFRAMGVDSWDKVKSLFKSVWGFVKGTGKVWYDYFTTHTKEEMWKDFKTNILHIDFLKEISEPIIRILLSRIGVEDFSWDKFGEWIQDWKDNWKPKLEKIFSMGADVIQHIFAQVQDLILNWRDPKYWVKQISTALVVLLSRTGIIMTQIGSLFVSGLILPALNKILPAKAFKWLMTMGGTDEDDEFWDKTEKRIRETDPFSTARNTMKDAVASGIILFRVDFPKEGRSFGFFLPSLSTKERQAHGNNFKKGIGVTWPDFKKIYKNNPKDIKLALLRLRGNAKGMQGGFTESEIYLEVARQATARAAGKITKGFGKMALGAVEWSGLNATGSEGRKLRWKYINDYQMILSDHYSGKKVLSDKEYQRVTQMLDKVKQLDDKKFKDFRKKHPNYSFETAMLEYYEGSAEIYKSAGTTGVISHSVNNVKKFTKSIANAAKHAIISNKTISPMLASMAGFAPSVPGTNVPTVWPSGIKDFLKVINYIESKGSYTAVNSTTQAFGRYQFLPSTWNEYAKKAGTPTRMTRQKANARQLPPPDEQDKVFIAFTAANTQWMKKKGLPINVWTMWLAHNLGRGSVAFMLGKGSPAGGSGAMLRRLNGNLGKLKTPSLNTAKDSYIKLYKAKVAKALGDNSLMNEIKEMASGAGDLAGKALDVVGSSMSAAIQMVFGGTGIVEAIHASLGVSMGAISTPSTPNITGTGIVSTSGGSTTASAYSGPIPARNFMCPGANHGKRPMTKMLVMHRTAGASYPGFYNRKCKDGLAAHFTIEKNGRLNLDVSEDAIAWHVGKYNSISIGIEIVGKFNKHTGKFDDITPKQAETIATLSKYLANKYNLTARDVYAHPDLAAKNAAEGPDARDFVKSILSGKSVQDSMHILGTKAKVQKVNSTELTTAVDKAKAMVASGKGDIYSKTAIPPSQKGEGEQKSAETGGSCNLQGKSLDGVHAEAISKLKKLCNISGGSLYINSAYRSPAYNRSIGASSGSYHVKGMALDIHWPVKTLAGKIQFLTNALSVGFTGIGIYGTFIHVDIGPKRAWGPGGTRRSLPTWASDIIMSGTSQPSILKKPESVVANPAGTTYIPGMGVVPVATPVLQMMQINNKALGAKINEIQGKLNQIAKDNIVEQTGMLQGIIEVSEINHTALETAKEGK